MSRSSMDIVQLLKATTPGPLDPVNKPEDKLNEDLIDVSDAATPGPAPVEKPKDKPNEDIIVTSKNTSKSNPDDEDDEGSECDDGYTEGEEVLRRYKMAPTSGNSFSSHRHIHLPLEKFQASKQPCFFIYKQRHKASDLAELLQGFCGRSKETMTSIQLEAWDLFYDSQEKEDNPFELEKGKATDFEMVDTYFRLFDDFFFLGILGGWYDQTAVSLRKGITTQFHGECIETFPIGILDGRGRRQPLKLLINISSSENENRKMRLTFYLGTLLHQMVHAFLAPSSCLRFDCQEKHKHEGVTAHGEAWQDIAYAVEKGVKKSFGLDLDLGREWAYVCELTVPGPWRASKRMSDWGFQEVNVLKQVDCCHGMFDFVSRRSCVVRYRPMTFKKGPPASGVRANGRNEDSGSCS